MGCKLQDLWSNRARLVRIYTIIIVIFPSPEPFLLYVFNINVQPLLFRLALCILTLKCLNSSRNVCQPVKFQLRLIAALELICNIVRQNL